MTTIQRAKMTPLELAVWAAAFVAQLHNNEAADRGAAGSYLRRDAVEIADDTVIVLRHHLGLCEQYDMRRDDLGDKP